MLQRAFEACGPVFGTGLLALSVLVWGIGFAALISPRQRQPRAASLLLRLRELSTQTGLLGSVAGMISAFSGFDLGESVDNAVLMRSLGLCYWTTAIGVFNALVATAFTMLLRNDDAVRAECTA